MQIFDLLAAWPGAVWLQNSGTAYLLVNAAHILGVALLVGAILPLDLRMIGFLRTHPIEAVAPLLLSVASMGLALALVTGLWLFTVQPKLYAANPAFLAKLVLIALALANIWAQHRSAPFQAALRGECPSAAVRALAGLSALLWLSALVAGRWIGFV
ncbi:MAG: DUF6644 family protein [Hyphomicrobium sp.]|uniref:DUF6644 family protein n=1 Tax=Hyphomicrobium sp. TaxID=82 RepID=UPI003D13F774